MSSDGSDLINDESEELGYDSGSSGMYSFRAYSLCFDKFVVSVSILGSDFFAPTGVKSKGGQFLAFVWRSN